MSRYEDTGTEDAIRHLDAIADTGTSHTLHPRQYVVRCEWCPHVFFGPTKAEAMRQFRAHENERIATAYVGPKWRAVDG